MTNTNTDFNSTKRSTWVTTLIATTAFVAGMLLSSFFSPAKAEVCFTPSQFKEMYTKYGDTVEVGQWSGEDAIISREYFQSKGYVPKEMTYDTFSYAIKKEYTVGLFAIFEQGCMSGYGNIARQEIDKVKDLLRGV